MKGNLGATTRSGIECDSTVEHCVCASKVVEPVRLLSVATVSNSVVVDATKIRQLMENSCEIISDQFT